MEDDRITILRQGLRTVFGELSISSNPRPLVGPFGRSMPFEGRAPLMDAVTDLFKKRFDNWSHKILVRVEHPIGLLGGCPGLGKTRALLEISDALQAMEEQVGRWTVKIVISYNNGNPPTIDQEVCNSFESEKIGAAKAFCLRVLFFAFFPCPSFTEFASAFPSDLLKTLQAKDVIGLIRHIAQEQFGGSQGTVYLAVDEVNFLLDDKYDGTREKRSFLRDTMIAFGEMVLDPRTFVFGLVAGTIVLPVKHVFTDFSYPIQALPIGLLNLSDVERLLDDLMAADNRWSEWRTCRALRVLLCDFAPLPRMAENLLRGVEQSLAEGNALHDVDFDAVGNRLSMFLPEGYDFSSFAERIVRDALLGNNVDRAQYVDEEKKLLTYEELERMGVIALAATATKSAVVQLPFALFRHFVSNLSGNAPLTKTLRSLCRTTESDSSMLSWQDFEELYMNMEALREMLLAERFEFIDCWTFYCVDASSTSVGGRLEMKLRKEVSTGTSVKRFPPAKAKAKAKVATSSSSTFMEKEEDLALTSSCIAGVGNVKLDAHYALIKNAAGAVFDTFTFRRVRGVEESQHGEDLARKKSRIGGTEEEEEEEETEEPDEENELPPVLFCGQQRFHRNIGAVSKEMIYKEAKKIRARIGNKVPHVFTIVSTKLTDDALEDLPANCVVLSGEQLIEFCGPVFSSRAVLFGNAFSFNNRVNVNTATRSELLTVPRVGEIFAKRIMDARGKRAFSDWEDLKTRVPLLPLETKDYLCF